MIATRRPRVTANRNMKGFALARFLAAAPEGVAKRLVRPPATLQAPVTPARSGSPVVLGG